MDVLQKPLSRLDICQRTEFLPRTLSALSTTRLDHQRFQLRDVLVGGLRNGGQIELYEDVLTGQLCVGKRLPRVWMLESEEDFAEAHPDLLENPWQEIQVTLAVSKALQLVREQASAGVCNCHGIFTDNTGDVLILMEYLPGGDLFEMTGRWLCKPGPGRESKVWPIVSSLLAAVTNLHAIGVAHGDVSLENALLTAGGEVCLIDFEAAVTGRLDQAKGSRGKLSYQAPEMHGTGTYDARAADLFACGVTAYGLAVGNYPWASTRPGVCKAFDFFNRRGLKAFLAQKRLRHADGSRGRTVSELLSSEFQELLDCLLNRDPWRRWEAFQVLHGYESSPCPSSTEEICPSLLGG